MDYGNMIELAEVKLAWLVDLGEEMEGDEEEEGLEVHDATSDWIRV